VGVKFQIFLLCGGEISDFLDFLSVELVFAESDGVFACCVVSVFTLRVP